VRIQKPLLNFGLARIRFKEDVFKRGVLFMDAESKYKIAAYVEVKKIRYCMQEYVIIPIRSFRFQSPPKLKIYVLYYE
jgi:hypothetical protein